MTLREARKMLEQLGFVSMGGTKHDAYLHPDGRQVPLPRGNSSTHVYGYLANKIRKWYDGTESGKTNQRGRQS